MLPGAGSAHEAEIPDFSDLAEFHSTTFIDDRGFTLLSNPKLPRTTVPASSLTQTGSAPNAKKINLATAPPWGAEKSYLIPALEIIGFDTLLNLFDRVYFGCCDYDVDFGSIKRNLQRGWGVDRDDFTINQLGHPYQGSVYHGFARASGLDYWPSLAYTFAGSLFWEIAGETTRPSENDQISTGIGGSFLGEALFRMSNFWLEREIGTRFWREVVAAAISPSVGFNRLAFGDRFKGIYPSKNPDYYSRVHMGIVAATQDDHGTNKEIDRYEGIVDFALDYGLPGKPGYSYDRPFDYFSFQAAASTAIGFENAATQGLLYGARYDLGRSYRGIWGAYGSYAYMAPQIFRLASTALSLGTTGEWRPSNTVALQGSGLLGIGYATVSTIDGGSEKRADQYGLAPQLLLALRLILGDRAALDLSAREYFVSGVSGSHGKDNVIRADASITWRIHNQHALSLRYQLSRRDSLFRRVGEIRQSRGTIGIFYTLLGRDRFGTGNWRDIRE